MQASTYSSEVGGAPGGQVNVTTKSGSNELHGSAWWFNRNEAFSAVPPFTPFSEDAEPPKLNLNQYGANIGGPVIKDKAFFFFNRESGRQVAGESVRSEFRVREAVPDDAESIADILNPIIRDGRFTVLDQELTVAQERDFIEEFPERGVFLVAEIDSRVVGFQTVDLFAAYTRAFDHVGVMGTYVGSKYRRRGVSKALFLASLPAARNHGFEKIFTFVRADNPAALCSYQAHGFRVIGEARRHAKVRGEHIDEVLIEKLLEQ